MKNRFKNLQIVHVETLSNLFLDVRLLISPRQILIFALNSTPITIRQINRLVQSLTKRQIMIKVVDLASPRGFKRYLKLNRSDHLIGYDIIRYDSTVITFLIDRLIHDQSINVRLLNRFNRHLFYLNCTNRSPESALNRFPSAKNLWRNWLNHHRLIDLRLLNRKPLKLIAGKTGLAISHRRPISKIKGSATLKRLLSREITEITTTYRLIQILPYPTFIDSKLKTSPFQRQLVNYSIPRVTDNYLDDTLSWALHTDHRYRLNSNLIMSFLPVYNVFKNLQGYNLKTIHRTHLNDYNLNIPNIEANVKVSSTWIHFGRHFHSVNVNLTKFKKKPSRFFKRSSRSGNWLINLHYRIRSPRSQAIIHLRSAYRLFSVKLNSNLNEYSLISSQIIWQLLLWRISEALILNGTRIQSVSSNQFRVSRVPKERLSKILKRGFDWLLNLKQLHLHDLIPISVHLTDPQLKSRLQIQRQRLLSPHRFVEALKAFQIITHVGRWSHQNLFLKAKGRVYSLGDVARIFLVKPGSGKVTLHVAKVTHAQWYRYNNDPDYHSRIIGKVEHGGSCGQIIPYRKLSPDQNVYANQHALRDFNSRELHYLYYHLDLKAYFKLDKSIEP